MGANRDDGRGISGKKDSLTLLKPVGAQQSAELTDLGPDPPYIV